MKAIEDGARLSQVIDALDESSNSLSIKLGYSSPGSIYHVINGVNNLSKGMIDRIVNTFPKVSYQFLKEGVGEPLLSGEELQTQLNLFNTADVDHEVEVVKKLLSIPSKLDRIIKLLEDKK